VKGSCEHGNEPTGSIKCWEVLEWLLNWWLLKKGSAPLSECHVVRSQKIDNLITAAVRAPNPK
jgi:hypothetical protein